ncbi:CD1375 family protein [Xylanibacillus composti]|uniref:ASCH domain-containing protein n=1 Tax=Xylanibacillus composti TaxID=1572762 RepID=A0A8J4H854_9BACL|nr:CD1375 family protein [Xylanibacillus composti]GIQ70779.1 hypothetical protein XYCOK13_36030 [Xylanibacillus composti]
MSEAIAKIYADLVRAGRRTIAQVPETVRQQVEQTLAMDNLS